MSVYCEGIGWSATIVSLYVGATTTFTASLGVFYLSKSFTDTFPWITDNEWNGTGKSQEALKIAESYFM